MCSNKYQLFICKKEEIYHKENKIKKVVLISRIGFFERCAEFLENYKKEEQQDIIIIKKLFAISYIRVYLKIFVDKIDNNKAEIIEIINKINGKENSKFREMMQIYVFKIILIKKI